MNLCAKKPTIQGIIVEATNPGIWEPAKLQDMRASQSCKCLRSKGNSQKKQCFFKPKVKFFPYNFWWTRKPRVPNTVSGGQLLLITSGSYGFWIGWDEKVWEATFLLDEKEIGRGRESWSTAPAWEKDQLRFHNWSEVGLRWVGMPVADYLFLDLLLITMWYFTKYSPCARHRANTLHAHLTEPSKQPCKVYTIIVSIL